MALVLFDIQGLKRKSGELSGDKNSFEVEIRSKCALNDLWQRLEKSWFSCITNRLAHLNIFRVWLFSTGQHTKSRRYSAPAQRRLEACFPLVLCRLMIACVLSLLLQKLSFFITPKTTRLDYPVTSLRKNESSCQFSSERLCGSDLYVQSSPPI